MLAKVPCGFICRFLLTLALFLAFGQGHAEDKAKLRPDEIRAAFLTKIPPYIQWPQQSAPEGTNSLLFVVLGEDPINPLLEEIFKKIKLNGRDVVLKVVKKGEPVPKCQILFVPQDGFESWQAWVKGSETAGTLTVGESEEFLKSGGIFKISIEDPKLVTHLSNARKAGIEINSKLLKLSKIYREAGR